MKQDFKKYSVMNPTFTISEVEATGSKAKLVLEPLENGYGHTIGNALRRVMLSSLPGSAITSIRIDGIDHQFTSLEGMKEDIIELILNLKLVRIRSTIEEPGTLTIDVIGPKQITAADIECSAGYEIVNSDQEIAMIADGKKFRAELQVEAGVGYKMADESDSDLVGLIPIDALFSPVVKVSYKVEETRVGRRTDYDRLVLDIETDGTITPLEAVEDASRILAKQFSQVYDPVIIEVKEEKEKLTPEEQEILSLTVEELDLPTRIANALRKGGYKNVGDLVEAKPEDIGSVKNLGEKSIQVIGEALKKKGVTLAE